MRSLLSLALTLFLLRLLAREKEEFEVLPSPSSLIVYLFVVAGCYYVVQTVLRIFVSPQPPALHYQKAKITSSRMIVPLMTN